MPHDLNHVESSVQVLVLQHQLNACSGECDQARDELEKFQIRDLRPTTCLKPALAHR